MIQNGAWLLNCGNPRSNRHNELQTLSPSLCVSERVTVIDSLSQSTPCSELLPLVVSKLNEARQYIYLAICQIKKRYFVLVVFYSILFLKFK